MDARQGEGAARQRHPPIQETVRESWDLERAPQAGTLREAERATEEEGHRGAQTCHPTHRADPVTGRSVEDGAMGPRRLPRPAKDGVPDLISLPRQQVAPPDFVSVNYATSV